MSIIKQIKFQLNRLCPSCCGSGKVIRGPGLWGPCGNCGGKGDIN